MITSQGTSPIEDLSQAGRAAALLMAAQALVLLALVVVSLVQVVSGGTDDVAQALTEAALVLVFAAGAAVLALALYRGKAPARTPTLVWNALLVPVGFSLMGGGAPAVGLAVLLVAAATIIAALLIPRAEPED
ncbi:hypothetical protein PZ938_19185 [Luteipulveratus sp. YIM 133132]|uniref:hypothetical protein n=1 Tax=Luteipulveratus flavus TaxID=3031728 RepID=UPI0023AF26EC|nr:hypothetical protein [Luteipulveratus sp. YIM 133132]MDE9367747.1 hypothetical protein [Luteipulveratus sp. YIM 133132]